MALRVYPLGGPTPVRGVDAIREIPSLLAASGAKKPMLVTGPKLYERGLADGVLDALRGSFADFTVFSGVSSEPTEQMAADIAALFTQNACDSMIAFGGGSPIDAAKAALALAARPDKPAFRLRGLLKVRRRLPPLIAVPTTAGTGSETTFAAVLTGGSGKYAITDPCLFPMYAVLDARLTLSLTPSVTADTGMDALTHAVEAYLCVLTNTRETYALCEAAVKAIFSFLPVAYARGSDIEARSELLKASFLAGKAFTRTGLGYVHAISHAVGAAYRIPHGRANAVILPYVLEDYGAAAQKKLARLARVACISADASDATAAACFIAAIRSMNARIGIGDKLDCIKGADVGRLASLAVMEADPVYPTPVIYDRARCERVILRIAGAQ